MDVDGSEEQYEEYTWAGVTRVRATTMLQGGFAGQSFYCMHVKYIFADCCVAVGRTFLPVGVVSVFPHCCWAHLSSCGRSLSVPTLLLGSLLFLWA